MSSSTSLRFRATATARSKTASGSSSTWLPAGRARKPRTSESSDEAHAGRRVAALPLPGTSGATRSAHGGASAHLVREKRAGAEAAGETNSETRKPGTQKRGDTCKGEGGARGAPGG